MKTTFEDELLAVLTEALEERQRTPSKGFRLGTRRIPRWAAATTVAAAALVIALVVPLLLPGGAGGADPAAAAALHRVALRAAEQPPGPVPNDGQFVYTKTESTQISVYVTGNGPSTNFVFAQPLTLEAWIGTDGSGRALETAGAITFASDEDRAAWVAAGSPALGERDVIDEIYGGGELYFLDTSGLPNDPDALRELIERREIVGGTDGDWQTFSIVGDLLRETSVQPAVRGALYEVAADLPGVEYVGRIHDAAGRPGIAVAYTHEGVRQEFIFDPKTAELLGENYVNVEDGAVDVESGGPGAIYPSGEAGTLFFTATYLGSGITESTGEVP